MPANDQSWFAIKFNFAGQEQMNRAIHNVDVSMRDMRDAFEEIADDFYDTTKKVFASEGREIGQPWKPLTDSSARAKEKEFPGKPILERTGQLKQSLTERTDHNAVCIIEGDKLIIGSKVKTEQGNISLVKLHQFGWNKPEILPRRASALRWGGSDDPVFSRASKAVRVDARPIFLMDTDKKEKWIRIFQENIQEKLEEASTVSASQRARGAGGRTSS